MALPELTKKQIEKKLAAYCKAKAPANLRYKYRVSFKIRGNNVTLYEERPAFGKPNTWVDIVVAQFRFNLKSKEWTLYCADRNSKWHPYYEAEPNKNFGELLKEVDEDPTGIFWG
jgi:hypothetical protein